MLRAGNIIFRCRDEWGRLNVHEFDGGPPLRIDSKRFLRRAAELGDTLDITLQRYACTLLQQNRPAFTNGEGRKP